MIKRSSLTWPIMLAVVLLALVVALLVIWIIGQAADQNWARLTVGTVFISLILLGGVVYFIWTIKEFRLNRRQANFIDSVTHELKSPIASIKLCLQTLELRSVDPEQQRELRRFMMEDIQRLDSLIDHLLAVARVDAPQHEEPADEVELNTLLATCADEVRRRYSLPPECITIDVPRCVVRGQKRDLEMVFLNLLDNAAKYGASQPEVHVQAHVTPAERVITRISDNGRGVRFELRRKIFKRFFRGGSELERTTKGTGLGLYIVKSLVSKMKGKISVHGRGALRGATFEVQLPGHAAVAPAPSAEEESPAATVPG
jgi:two-component system, OmpR family, phosphate regulon sensor histidine kinase PhoR